MNMNIGLRWRVKAGGVVCEFTRLHGLYGMEHWSVETIPNFNLNNLPMLQFDHHAEIQYALGFSIVFQ